MRRCDLLILGGGIVGLATAYQFSRRHPQMSVMVLEKEAQVGTHQTGRNSGVMHSGIYYKPGSLKAINCLAGKAAMEAFCQEHGVPYDICGKVIVAVNEAEIPALERIYERGQANRVPCEPIGPERLRELEPHAHGVRALHVPSTGIVNYRRVTEKMAELIRTTSGEVVVNAKVEAIQASGDGYCVHTSHGDFAAKQLVNCTGLYSDRIARLAGVRPIARIVPFRGEYYELTKSAEHLCRNLIYPVPDPQFPFLGVHFTRMMEGGVECGPNAVLAFAREGYGKCDINLRDLLESLTYSGFLRMASKHWRMGLGEMWRSFSKTAFVRALAHLIPEIRADQLHPARAGVRAQALAPDGSLVDDFAIHQEGRMIHVLNAPSPAATSSLNIGKWVADKLDAIT